MATLESIQARIAKLQAQAEAVVAKQSSTVLVKIRDLMQKHALTTSDIEAFVGRQGDRKESTTTTKAATNVNAKYVDPKTGAMWSGHGRPPVWIANAKDRSKFEIARAAVDMSASKVKAGPKKGRYVRGPQPALYRDPKSGATWSGLGRPPAWIASVKDRAKFLIAQSSESTPSSGPKVARRNL